MVELNGVMVIVFAYSSERGESVGSIPRCARLFFVTHIVM